jgi:hypothetical protein
MRRSKLDDALLAPRAGRHRLRQLEPLMQSLIVVCTGLPSVIASKKCAISAA